MLFRRKNTGEAPPFPLPVPSCQDVSRVWEECSVVLVFQASSLLTPHIFSTPVKGKRHHIDDPAIHFRIKGVEREFEALLVQRRLKWPSRIWERFVGEIKYLDCTWLATANCTDQTRGAPVPSPRTVLHSRSDGYSIKNINMKDHPVRLSKGEGMTQ